MTTFHIIRHGQTEWNIERRLQGHMDSPLTLQGQNEAELVAEELVDVHFDRAYSSDSLRALRTAEIIALEKKMAIETTQLLREGSYGVYEGRLVDEYHQELRAAIQEWEALTDREKFIHAPHPSFETDEQMVSRCLTFLREIAAAYPHETVLVVSHGGLIRKLLIHLGYGTYQELGVHSIKNCARVVIDCDGVEFFIRETHRVEKAEQYTDEIR